MDDSVWQHLKDDLKQRIDITTIGRKSGQPRRWELNYIIVDDTAYLTGPPGKRDWVANLAAHPAFTFHVKTGMEADLPAHATVITDEATRRAITTAFVTLWDRPDLADEWTAASPLIKVSFEGNNTMNDEVFSHLEADQKQRIDITTIGRKSGNPSRKEINYQIIDGKTYISGSPGKRDWYANLTENPGFTFHVKSGMTADLPAHARPITDADERRQVLTTFVANWNRSDALDEWLANSPLVEVTFDK